MALNFKKTINVKTISDEITKLMNFCRPPKAALPTLLLVCSLIRRPGMSASLIASKCLSKQGRMGLKGGPMPDGSTNGYEAMVVNLVKEITDAIKFDGVGQAATPIGAFSIMGTCQTPSGPGTIQGTNINSPLIRTIFG